MKTSKLLRMGAILLIVILIFSACSNSPGGQSVANPAAGNTASEGASSEGATNGTIKLVIEGPMTGDSASQGIQEKNGAQIAIDEINAAGGIEGKKIVTEVVDDQAIPNQATLGAQKVIGEDDVLAVVGPVQSSCALSGVPIYEKVNLPVISPTNTNPTVTEQGWKNYFTIIASDNLSGKTEAYMAVKELGCKKVAFLWENSDLGKGLRGVALPILQDTFGMQPAGDESYVANTDRDFSAQITKFKGAGVDAILTFGEYTAAALIAQQNQSLGLKAKVICSNGAATPEFIKIAGDAGEGTYVMTGYDPNDPGEKQTAFTKKFEEKYKEQPGEWAAHAYDVIYLIKAAYEAGGTTRDTLITALHSLKGFEGVTGKIEFDEKGAVPNKRLGIMKVENGTFVTYTPKNFTNE